MGWDSSTLFRTLSRISSALAHAGVAQRSAGLHLTKMESFDTRIRRPEKLGEMDGHTLRLANCPEYRREIALASLRRACPILAASRPSTCPEHSQHIFRTIL